MKMDRNVPVDVELVEDSVVADELVEVSVVVEGPAVKKEDNEY